MTVLCAAELAEGEKLLAKAKRACLGAILSQHDEPTGTWQWGTLSADSLETIERALVYADALLAAARQAETMREALEPLYPFAEKAERGPLSFADVNRLHALIFDVLAAVAAPNEAKQ